MRWLICICTAACGFAQTLPNAPHDALPITLTSAVVSRLCNWEFVNFQPAPEIDFMTTDPWVCVMVRWSDAHKGDKVRFDWINPLGTIMKSTESETPYWGTGSHSSMAPGLQIARNPSAASLGTWHVRVLYNGAGIVDLPFRISAPPPSKLELLSEPVLPRATVGARYEYHLTVRGGDGSYRWTVSRGVPDGLSFSPDGVLSGTPAQLGGYQFAVTASDQSGNSITRTVALGVAMPPKARVTFRRLAGSLAGVVGCAAGPNTTEFSSSQKEITLDFTITGGREDRWGNRLAYVDWLNPSGDIAYTTHVVKPGDGEDCFRQTFPLAQQSHVVNRVVPGKWRVRVVWGGGEAFSVPFVVKSEELTTGVTTPAPGRWALVIGNARYEHLPAIPSAAKDITLIKEALRRDGFDVTEKLDVGLEEWRRVERDFLSKVQKGGVAVLYFAGYGIHEGQANWLTPANFDPKDPGPLSTRAYSLARLRQLLEDKEVNLKILFLNASSSAALAHGTQRPGLAAPAADPHTVICLAAISKRAEAAEPGDQPSSFTRALVKVIDQSDSGLQQLDVELGKALQAEGGEIARPLTLMANPPEFHWRLDRARAR